MWRKIGLLALLSAAVTASGCMAMAGQAIKEVRGARGEAIVLHTLPAGAITAARGLEFKPASYSLGPQVAPAAVLSAWDRAASQLVARLSPQFPGGAPALTFDTDVLYYQGKGFSSGGLLLAHVRLRSGNEPAGDVLLKAESESFRAGSEEALTRAAVEALGRYLRRERGLPE